MDSAGDTPKGWVAPFGYPRIKACSRLPMAFRSVPRPSSPPGAKASTECPSRAPCASGPTLEQNSQASQQTHHAQEPSPEPKPARVPPRIERNGKPAAQTRSSARHKASTAANTVSATSHLLNSAQLSTPLNPVAMPGGTTLGRNASRRHNHDPFRSDSHPAPQRAASHDPAQRRSASQTPEMPCAPRSAPEPDSQ